VVSQETRVWQQFADGRVNGCAPAPVHDEFKKGNIKRKESIVSQETRVWQQFADGWKNVHLHRSMMRQSRKREHQEKRKCGITRDEGVAAVCGRVEECAPAPVHDELNGQIIRREINVWHLSRLASQRAGSCVLLTVFRPAGSADTLGSLTRVYR
jgi:hypothetical protein